MIDVMAHRGPDGSGVVGDAVSAVAMCRLRVRSRVGDPVPFRDPASDDSFAYNGEVYRVAGTDAATQSTPAGGVQEALSVAQRRRVDGMYALAHRDPTGDVHVTRDPLGIKPVYLRRHATGCAVSSELPALVGALGPVSVRREAVAQFLLAGRVIDGGTFYSGIEPVPAGRRLTIRQGEVVDAGEVPPEAPAAGGLRDAIRESVRRTTLADRPLGLAVSGGLDSTILAAELSRAEATDLTTVSVLPRGSGDGVRSLDELGLPDGAWRSWRHHVVDFGPEDLLDGVPGAVAALGEPTALTSVPMYAALAALARRHGITVLIVGEGADELFGGYRSYLYLPQLRTAADFYVPPARVEAARDVLPAAQLASALDCAMSVFGGSVDRVRDLELAHSLEPLLRRTDHLLMGDGIEGRTPFLHFGLPALAAALPTGALVAGGQTKVALRSAYATELPRFRDEVKRSFRAPFTTWLTAAVAGRIGADLRADLDRLAGVGVVPDGVRRVGDRLRGGDADALPMAFSLLTLGAWLRWLESQ